MPRKPVLKLLQGIRNDQRFRIERRPSRESEAGRNPLIGLG